MKLMAEDTSPEAEVVLIGLYRRMPDWRKFRCITELNEALKQMQTLEIRERFPDATPYELKMRLASRWISPELMRLVYGWDPEKEGY